MRLVISKALFLVMLTMGVVITTDTAAGAYPELSLATAQNPEYVAQFRGFPNRPEPDDDDDGLVEEIREEVREERREDRREDIREERRDNIEDDIEDCQDEDGRRDQRECIEDVQDDLDDRPGRR